jgi:hypothetical protein
VAALESDNGVFQNMVYTSFQYALLTGQKILRSGAASTESVTFGAWLNQDNMAECFQGYRSLIELVVMGVWIPNKPSGGFRNEC